MAEPSNEIARAWRDLIERTAEVFGSDGSQAVPAPVSPNIENPSDMSKGRDAGIGISKQYVVQAAEKSAERGKELTEAGKELSDSGKAFGKLLSRKGNELANAGARLKLIANLISAVPSVYEFITKGDAENYGDLGAAAGDFLAEYASNIGVRLAGRAFALAWMTYGVFEFGTAIAAEAEGDDIRKSLIDEILREAYFSFMNKAVWAPYASHLADDRAEANEFNVSRPKALKAGVGGQIFQIEQEINGLLYSGLLPPGTEDWFYRQYYLGHPSQQLHDGYVRRLRDWINGRLAQIDQINLDMNNWLN